MDSEKVQLSIEAMNRLTGQFRAVRHKMIAFYAKMGLYEPLCINGGEYNRRRRARRRRR